jgi:hypothetical protein
VLYATYLYNANDSKTFSVRNPPHIEISASEKKDFDDHSFTIKVPTTPYQDKGLTTSTPGSPALHHKKTGSSRGYFPQVGKKE